MLPLSLNKNSLYICEKCFDLYAEFFLLRDGLFIFYSRNLPVAVVYINNVFLIFFIVYMDLGASLLFTTEDNLVENLQLVFYNNLNYIYNNY